MGKGVVSFVLKLWPKSPMGLPPLWLAFGFLKAKAAKKTQPNTALCNYESSIQHIADYIRDCEARSRL
jgi:hypothetical protein